MRLSHQIYTRASRLVEFETSNTKPRPSGSVRRPSIGTRVVHRAADFGTKASGVAGGIVGGLVGSSLGAAGGPLGAFAGSMAGGTVGSKVGTTLSRANPVMMLSNRLKKSQEKIEQRKTMQRQQARQRHDQMQMKA